MEPPLRYQSPINLCHDDILCISQSIYKKGKNKGALYSEEDKIFILQDKIIIKIDDKKYQLVEYHFHIPGEHEINSKKYPA